MKRLPISGRQAGCSLTTLMLTTTWASPWFDQGKLDEAIAEFQTAIRLKPDHVKAHKTWQRPGTPREAEGAGRQYRTVIRLKPAGAAATTTSATPWRTSKSGGRGGPVTARVS